MRVVDQLRRWTVEAGAFTPRCVSAPEGLRKNSSLLRFSRVPDTVGAADGYTLDVSEDRSAIEAGDSVDLQLVVAGRMTFEADGAPQDVWAGQLVVFVAKRPQRIRTSGAQIVAASVPRALLMKMLPPDAQLHGLVLSEPQMALLGHLLWTFVGGNTSSCIECVALAASLGGVRAVAAEGADVPPSTDIAKRDQAMVHIDKMMHQPDLTVEMIAAASAMSRSALYRLFKPVGGVARCILRRRVHALCATMSRPGETRPFHTLAYHHGFACPSSANRSFKDVLGVTPGRFRKMALDVSTTD